MKRAVPWLLLLAAIALALLAGARWLTGREGDWLVLTTFRLPRVAGATLIGALLGLSGCLLQSVTRNPLADPGLLGLNAGANLALIFLLLGVDAVTAGQCRTPAAFAGVTLAAALVWALARRRGATAPDTMLIVGIAIGAALHAAALIMAFSAPPDILTRAVVWGTGNVAEVGWRDLGVLTGTLIAVATAAAALCRSLDVLALGDDAARVLGVRVGWLRLGATALAVLSAAVCVSVGGAVAGLGMLAGNLARRLHSTRMATVLPLSACCGALFLVSADTLGRTAFGAFEVPAGTLIACVGTPYFLWLLVTR